VCRVALVTAAVVALLGLVSTAGAVPQLVTEPGTITLPVWSPNGKQIAWIDATLSNQPSPPAWQGWEAGSDGSRPHMIISGPALSSGASQLDWFAPKTLTLFGNFSIYIKRIGEKPKLLAANITDEFSSDATGDHFAYEKSPCGGQCDAPSQVVVINRTTGARSLIGNGSTHYGDPTISPDGTQVAFTSTDGLLVSRVDGSGLHKLTSGHAGCPQWSPDGRNILFIDDDSTLRVIPATGGTSRVLASRVGCGFAPLNFGWSPDSETVTVIGPGGRGALTLINIATGQSKKVPGFSEVTGFAWSPDSSQLLVAARTKPSACSSLWRVNPDGSNRQLIVRCG
jgi:Tol biopolymer transport system component